MQETRPTPSSQDREAPTVTDTERTVAHTDEPPKVAPILKRFIPVAIAIVTAIVVVYGILGAF